jgi:predicted DNA-binding protein YlxM (UPF0122 family)
MAISEQLLSQPAILIEPFSFPDINPDSSPDNLAIIPYTNGHHIHQLPPNQLETPPIDIPTHFRHPKAQKQELETLWRSIQPLRQQGLSLSEIYTQIGADASPLADTIKRSFIARASQEQKQPLSPNATPAFEAWQPQWHRSTSTFLTKNERKRWLDQQWQVAHHYLQQGYTLDEIYQKAQLNHSPMASTIRRSFSARLNWQTRGQQRWQEETALLHKLHAYQNTGPQIISSTESDPHPHQFARHFEIMAITYQSLLSHHQKSDNLFVKHAIAREIITMLNNISSLPEPMRSAAAIWDHTPSPSPSERPLTHPEIQWLNTLANVLSSKETAQNTLIATALVLSYYLGIIIPQIIYNLTKAVE